MNRAPVDEHAIGGAEVLERPAFVVWADLGVPAGGAGIVQDDVTGTAAPDRGASRRNDQAPGGWALDREQRASSAPRMDWLGRLTGTRPSEL